MMGSRSGGHHEAADPAMGSLAGTPWGSLAGGLVGPLHEYRSPVDNDMLAGHVGLLHQVDESQGNVFGLT
jgi:hypothetical protein